MCASPQYVIIPPTSPSHPPQPPPESVGQYVCNSKVRYHPTHPPHPPQARERSETCEAQVSQNPRRKWTLGAVSDPDTQVIQKWRRKLSPCLVYIIYFFYICIFLYFSIYLHIFKFTIFDMFGLGEVFVLVLYVGCSEGPTSFANLGNENTVPILSLGKWYDNPAENLHTYRYMDTFISLQFI